MISRISLLFALLAIFTFFPGQIRSVHAQEQGDETQEAASQTGEPQTPPVPEILPEHAPIQAELEARMREAKTEALRERLTGIEAFYSARGYRPVWHGTEGPNEKAAQMVDALNRSHEDGLHPQDYDSAELAAKMNDAANTAWQELEVHLSTAAVSYAQHMHSGRLNPRSVNREIVIYPDTISPAAVLSDIERTTSLPAYLRLLAPHTPRYERLRTALAAYRRIARNGGWTTIADGDVIKAGDSDPRVPDIRARMREAGLFRGDEGGLVYDSDLESAVRRFQLRNGLETDGVIGPATREVMNISVEERITTMEVNMERNRWMQNDFGPYHIIANLADQVVKLVDNGETLHAEVIQVGAPYHRTPVFSDEMEYIEINPYWNVPVSIAVNEYLPKLRRNPGVLAAENIELLSGGRAINASGVSWSSYGKGNFPFRLRQRPGSGNALGRIKFMFPNQYNVYMHDTPSKSKFNAAQRYFSHGCLRLRDPLTMAEAILSRQGWDRARVERVVASGKRTVVQLEQKIPVHVVYITSYVNKDGSVHFREDVYGRDTILAKALESVRGR